MTLLRPIRPLPYQPTGEDLRKLLKQYGCRRRRAAEIMDVKHITIERYALPWASKNKRIIPRVRWRYLVSQLEAEYQAKVRTAI